MFSKSMDLQTPLSPSPSAPALAARPGSLLGYVVALLAVGLASIFAFLAEHIIAAPNLALVFVIPVLVIAIAYDLGAALLSVIASVAAFDLFFVTPRYSLAVASPTDLWAIALLGLVAVLTSGLAARSRRRGLDAEREARRAEALRSLAHKVVEGAPRSAITVAAAETLSRIFEAPAIVAIARDGDLGARASTDAAKLSKADEEAARWALQNGLPTRAQSFPFDAARFDFWPVKTSDGQAAVLGVEDGPREQTRAEAERYVELVGVYLLAGVAQSKV